jgi:hypothetical protein
LARPRMRVVAIRRFERLPRRAEHHATHAVYPVDCQVCVFYLRRWSGLMLYRF